MNSTLIDSTFSFSLFDDDPLFTVSEAAKYLSVSPSTVRKLVRQGQLQGVWITADMRLRRSELNRYIEKSQKPPRKGIDNHE